MQINYKSIYFLKTCAVLFIIALYIPYLIFGEESFIGLPFDFLNSNVVWTKIISENNMAFVQNCAQVYPSIMNQPRVTLGSELNFIFLLYKIFPPFWALVVNSFLISIIAFLSFSELLNYFFKGLNNYYKVGVSLLFALLPFWTFAGISTAGFPLVFVILNKLWKGRNLNWPYYLFLIFYVFYSNLLVYCIFLYFFATVYFIVRSILEKKINWAVFVIIAVMFMLGSLSDYRIAQYMLNRCFITNRDDIYNNLETGFRLFAITVRYGNLHAQPLHFPFVMCFCFLAFLYRAKTLVKDKILWYIVGTILLADLLSANVVGIFVNNVLKISFLREFSFYRFNMINQIGWYFLFGYLILRISEIKKKFPQLLAITFLFLQGGYLLTNNIPFQNIQARFQPKNYSHFVKFSEFFLLDEYKKIEKILPTDKKEYKLIHYGIEPAASNYHGYSTVDGFLAIFDKNYAKEFDELVAPMNKETKNMKMERFYHKYIPKSSFLPDEKSIPPTNLNLNFSVLEKLHPNYMISTVQLTNSQFQQIGKVPSKFWKKLYIYQINYTHK